MTTLPSMGISLNYTVEKKSGRQIRNLRGTRSKRCFNFMSLYFLILHAVSHSIFFLSTLSKTEAIGIIVKQKCFQDNKVVLVLFTYQTYSKHKLHFSWMYKVNINGIVRVQNKSQCKKSSWCSRFLIDILRRKSTIWNWSCYTNFELASCRKWIKRSISTS